MALPDMDVAYSEIDKVANPCYEYWCPKAKAWTMGQYLLTYAVDRNTGEVWVYATVGARSHSWLRLDGTILVQGSLFPDLEQSTPAASVGAL
jgi:hypothetical protein